jgi:hypothetical protein
MADPPSKLGTIHWIVIVVEEPAFKKGADIFGGTLAATNEREVCGPSPALFTAETET